MNFENSKWRAGFRRFRNFESLETFTGEIAVWQGNGRDLGSSMGAKRDIQAILNLPPKLI